MRHKLRRWNQVEVGDIFRRLEEVESFIYALRAREDRERGLSPSDFGDLRAKLAMHHFLLRRDLLVSKIQSLVVERGGSEHQVFLQGDCCSEAK